MLRIRTLVTQVFVITSLALGRISYAVSLLDLLQPPAVARVIVSRRRRLTYTELFSRADRDGWRGSPGAQAEEERADRAYQWVDTA